jgi:hypothetical protein
MVLDVYGRLTLLIERINGQWRVLEVGDDGKRGLCEDVVIPAHLTEAEIPHYIDVLFHEAARPGASVRRVS